MGRSIRCTYRLELSYVDFRTKSKQIQEFGLMAKDIKPTSADIKRYRDAMNQSIMNGANKHINGLQSLYSNGRLIDQRTNQVVATYQAPMFEVID